MDLSELEALHVNGHDETAEILFAQMCRKALYGEHRLPDDVSHLVHYTTLGTLLSMLGVAEAGAENYRLATRVAKTVKERRGASVGYLRLYDTFSSNDPNEGAFFVTSADKSGSFQGKYSTVWNLFKDRSASPAYHTSLTYISDVRDVDNLVFWRTYGREGTGCALAFPRASFEGQANLFRVRYGGAPAASCLDTLFGLLDEYSQIPGAPKFTRMSRISELPQPLLSVLSPLVYLYKSEAYEYEKEARIVVPYSDLQNGLYLQGSSITGITVAWRHFAEVPALRVPELLVSESHIVLGPTVKLAANIQFVLEKVLRQRGLYGPKVKISRIAYRR